MRYHQIIWLSAGLLLAGAAQAEPDTVVLYPAFGTPAQIEFEGRVIEARDAAANGPATGALDQLVRNARLFKNEEREHVPVRLRLADQQWAAKTDDEGYFSVSAAAPADLRAGWHTVQADTKRGSGQGEWLLLSPANQLGLISDLDDTLLVTEVNHRGRMLANTFLKSPAQREAVPGMAWLYTTVLAANPQPDAAPLFYLSASPRQLQGPIVEFLRLNQFPRGVLITKRIGLDSRSAPLLDQLAYKTQKINDILARTPSVRYVLVGDDGERDPVIFDGVRRQHPERIQAIWIRRVNPVPQPLPNGQLELGEAMRAVAKRTGAILR